MSVVAAPLRVGQAALEAGTAAERRAREEMAVLGERALLSAADAVITRMLDDGIAEQIAERVLRGPELERIIEAAFRSSLPDELITQLLESEAVWVLVDEIARSPSVTEAIAHQGTGFLDQVTERARDRSRHADAHVQRIAERLRRRRGGDQDKGALTLPPAPDSP